METLKFRIRYADFKAIRKLVPAQRGETMSNYFNRVRMKLASLDAFAQKHGAIIQ